MAADLGVKNKFFDKQHVEPQRWKSMEQPSIYVGSVVAAVAFYVAYLCECSKLEETLSSTNDAIIELGERGIFTSLVESVPIEPYILKVCVVIVCSVLITLGLYHFILWAN